MHGVERVKEEINSKENAKSKTNDGSLLLATAFSSMCMNIYILENMNAGF